MVKIFSFHAFALIDTDCLRKKLVSRPDKMLFFEQKRFSSEAFFCILGAKFGDEEKLFLFSIILYEWCLSPLLRMQMVSVFITEIFP